LCKSDFILLICTKCGSAFNRLRCNVLNHLLINIAMRNILTGISCVVVLCMPSCMQREQQKETIRTVKVVSAENYGEVKTATFPGKVKPASEVNLAFRISGPIAKIHVREGQFVRKGELLAEMDQRDYQLQLAATEAEYTQIKAEAERVIKLYEKQSVSENDYDKARLGLQQITAKYEAHKNALEDTKLKAPFNGYIQKRFFDSNETVAAGMPVFSMFSSDVPEVEINIPASEYIKRDLFDKFECYFEIFPGKTFPLELISINHKANLNQLYTLRFRLEAEQGSQLPSPGMSTIVTIAYKPQSTGLVSIPITAVFEVDDQPTVWVCDTTVLTVNARKIKIDGVTNDGRVIVSGGLQAGEQVVSAGVRFLSDGDSVKLLAKPGKSNVGGLL
jgi:RND family efflux transporter MFP subunit